MARRTSQHNRSSKCTAPGRVSQIPVNVQSAGLARSFHDWVEDEPATRAHGCRQARTRTLAAIPVKLAAVAIQIAVVTLQFAPLMAGSAPGSPGEVPPG